MRQTILIKPASSLCNAHCAYCFYEDVSNCRETKSYGYITKEVWTKLVDDSIHSPHKYNSINFAFQGGEPLLAGLSFFEEFVRYVEKNKNQLDITYSLQTNGILLDDAFCQLFKKHRFLIGLSIDGFQENHDKFRFYQQNGAFKQVMRGLALLRKYEIEFNVLTVLTKELAKHPETLMEFYMREEFEAVQLIPCLPNFNESPNDDAYSLNPPLFESFYTTFYDLWLAQLEKGNYLSENLIDNVVNLFLGGPVTRCGMLGQCERQCIVEADGGVYPCDFYVLDEFELGNIIKSELSELLISETIETFQEADNHLPKICSHCPLATICNGNCKRQRVTFVDEDTCGYRALLERVKLTLPRVVNALEKLA